MAEREIGSAANLGMRLTLFYPATVQDPIVCISSSECN